MNRTQLCLASLCLMACSQREVTPSATALPAISVETEVVRHRAMPRFLSVTGALVADRRSEVAANAAGVVLKYNVERGDFVKAGAPLVQLDTRSAVLSKSEALANLSNMQAQLELDQSTCKRNESLLQQGAISKEEWERANARCQLSAGATEMARTRSDLAKKALGDATVRAPFSGTVGERFVNIGEYVQPSSKILTLTSLDPLRLQFNVQEVDIGRVHLGQVVRFEVASFPSEQFQAIVKYIDPNVRAASRDLVVEAGVANSEQRLRPGMFATGKVELEDVTMLVVPAKALLRRGSFNRVFAVVDGRIEERVVQVGSARDEVVAILDGVNAEERVVLRPDALVRDGAPVK